MNDRTPQDFAKKNPDHYYMDGQTVDFNAKFVDPRSGAELEHPHDPQAQAKDVIQCRCTYAVTNKRDKNGRLIRKPANGLPSIPTQNIPVINRPIEPEPIRAFVPAKTIKEAEERLNSFSIKVNAKSMKIEHLNKILEAVDKVPKGARPTVITDKTGYEQLFGKKISRKSSEFQGMAQTVEVFDRAALDYKVEKVLVINSREFKTPLEIAEKKRAYNDYYAKIKDGKKWYFNEFEGSTHYHEMAHLYDRNISNKTEWVQLTDKWHRESKVDMIKVTNGDFSGQNGSEAFAEAFASYYGNNKGGLPDYIVSYLDKILK
jgi:hypothetical protein